jgi:recombination protein RecT
MKTDGSDMNDKGRCATDLEKSPITTLREQINKMAPEFQKALPNKMTAEHFMRVTMTAIQTNPKLAECSQISFFGALLQSCQLGLEPNTPLGQAYLIPRWNGGKKCLECNFQLGYQGILDLAYRSKEYRRIVSEVVYEGDEFHYKYGMNPVLDHDPSGKTEKPTYVWALYELVNGGVSFKVWTWDAVMKHAEEFSESFKQGFSPWTANKESQEAMARKTVLVSLLKYAPKSVELASAVNSDERVLNMRKITDGSHSFMSFDIDVPQKNTGNKENARNDAGERAGAASATVQAGADLQREQGATESAASAPTAKTEERKSDRKSGIFSSDEEAALEEQYEREKSGDDGPDFSR